MEFLKTPPPRDQNTFGRHFSLDHPNVPIMIPQRKSQKSQILDNFKIRKKHQNSKFKPKIISDLDKFTPNEKPHKTSNPENIPNSKTFDNFDNLDNPKGLHKTKKFLKSSNLPRIQILKIMKKYSKKLIQKITSKDGIRPSKIYRHTVSTSPPKNP